MSYLLIQILICLLIAGLIGMIIGWLLRGDCKKALRDNDSQWENRLIDTNNKWEQKIQSLLDEHNEITQEADFKIINLRETINRAKNKIAILEQKLSKANDNIIAKEDEIKKLQIKINSLQKELELSREDLENTKISYQDKIKELQTKETQSLLENNQNTKTDTDKLSIPEAQLLLNNTTSIEDEEQEIETSKPSLLKEAKNGKKDNLTLVKGIGKVLEERLNNLGIFHFEQIASWTKTEQAWIDKYMSFPGRVEREEWVQQAKKLLKGIETEFAKRVKSGDVPSSKKE